MPEAIELLGTIAWFIGAIAFFIYVIRFVTDQDDKQYARKLNEQREFGFRFPPFPRTRKPPKHQH